MPTPIKSTSTKYLLRASRPWDTHHEWLSKVHDGFFFREREKAYQFDTIHDLIVSTAKRLKEECSYTKFTIVAVTITEETIVTTTETEIK